MKGRLFVFALLAALLAVAALPAAPAAADLAEACVRGREEVMGFVRLHVVADSDDPVAQALKLEVRDACLSRARELLSECADADAAWQTVNAHLGELSEAAKARAGECGWEGTVRVEVGMFDFPTRAYGDVTLPAGRYRAMRVVIGSGEGRNWWCVLYPTLCMPEDYEPDEPVRFYSSVVRWLRALFGGDRDA